MMKGSLIMILLASLFSCGEVKTSARLENGPRFVLGGSGRLASFRIYGPRSGHKIATPFDAKSLMWRIQPTTGYSGGDRVQGLTLDIGKVPTGYTQTVPPSNGAPLLPSKAVYYFFAETTDAPPAEGFFYLEGDVPIEITVPGLCQSGFVGDVRPIKCGTNNPYVEPEDLALFVKQNRVER